VRPLKRGHSICKRGKNHQSAGPDERTQRPINQARKKKNKAKKRKRKIEGKPTSQNRNQKKTAMTDKGEQEIITNREEGEVFDSHWIKANHQKKGRRRKIKGKKKTVVRREGGVLTLSKADKS